MMRGRKGQMRSHGKRSSITWFMAVSNRCHQTGVKCSQREKGFGTGARRTCGVSALEQEAEDGEEVTEGRVRWEQEQEQEDHASDRPEPGCVS
jgi:hypothetical protein